MAKYCSGKKIFKNSYREKLNKNSKNPRKKKPIKFPSIFNDNTSNEQIFEKILTPKIKDCFEGVSFTLLTYGISGSGKTFTIFGNDSNRKKIEKKNNSKGIIFFTIDKIFDLKESIEFGLGDEDSENFKNFQNCLENEKNEISKEEDFKVDITASFIEIYNENVYDLLAVEKNNEKSNPDQFSHNNQFERKLTIIESPFTKGVIVPDLKNIKIENPEKLKELVKAVQDRRIVSPNLNNNYSSR